MPDCPECCPMKTSKYEFSKSRQFQILIDCKFQIPFSLRMVLVLRITFFCSCSPIILKPIQHTKTNHCYWSIYFKHFLNTLFTTFLIMFRMIHMFHIIFLLLTKNPTCPVSIVPALLLLPFPLLPACYKH